MPEEITAELTEEFRKLTRTHFQTLHRQLELYGLYVGQPVILLALKKEEQLTQKELAQRTDTSPSALSVSLRRMEKAGLIMRLPDSGDLRANCIALTSYGKETAEKCNAGWIAANEAMFAGFSGAEMRRLVKAFVRMTGNLENYRAEHNACDRQKRCHFTGDYCD